MFLLEWIWEKLICWYLVHIALPVKFFFKHDICRQSYEKFFLVGYFNAEETEPRLCEF